MSRPQNRRGMGVIFLFVLCMIVVVSIFMVMQAMTEKSTSQHIGAANLGHTAGVVAESCVEEATYFLSFDSNGGTPRNPLASKIREFVPDKTLPQSKKPIIEEGLKYHYSCTFKAAATLAAYEKEKDVKAAAVEIGLIAQKPLPPESKWCNESYGKIGFSQAVQVAHPAIKRSTKRLVQYQKTFKVLLLGQPYPFNNFTLIIRPRDTTRKNRLHKLYDLWAQLEKDIGSLPPLPIEALDRLDDVRPFVTTVPELKPDSLNIPSLISNATITDADAFRSQLQREFDNFKDKVGLDRLPRDKEQEWQDNEVYELMYNEGVWEQRATHVIDNFSEFILLASKDGVLRLNGVYFIRKGFTIDHDYVGRGVIVTPSTEGIVIRKAKRKATGSRMVLLSMNKDIVFASGCQSPVQADLNAPRGTIQGYNGIKIEGTVFIENLPATALTMPHILYPPGSAYEAWQPGQPLDDKYASKLRIFLSPDFLRRDYWNRLVED